MIADLLATERELLDGLFADDELWLGLLLAAILSAGIAVELVLVARWFKWPY